MTEVTKTREGQTYPQLDQPSLSEPINNTRLRRFLVITALKLARRFQDRSSPVVILTPNICVKSGDFRDLAEARTMQFIAQNTSIPVPEVYCSFKRKGQTYIVMERIKGQMATVAWSTLTHQSRTKVLQRLKEMINELRSIPPKNQKIASVDGGSLWDCRLPSNLQRFGPFANAQEFHSFLRSGIETAPPGHHEVGEMIAFHRQDCGPPVLTHGDLSSLNILLDGDEIVGIIDWETAGWYPSYWEYTCASQVNPRNPFWADHISEFLDPWPDALRAEKTRQRWWGAF